MSSLKDSRAAIPRRSPALHTIARHACRYDELRKAILDGMNTGEDVWSIGKRGETLLHAAVYSNNPDSVACVLRGRPELLAVKDVKGETPLHKAIRLKPSNAKGIQRQQTILKMLLDENRVDLNAFSDYVWVAKAVHFAQDSWRLNCLRFAVVYNATEPVVALLEAHGATMGHDPDGTDEPLTAPIFTEFIYPKKHSCRAQFFVGLTGYEALKRRTVAGQYLMLRRYPAAMHLGSPTLTEIMAASPEYAAQTEFHELLIGTHFPAPQLANRIEYMLRSPFLLDVIAMEGGMGNTLNVGELLRDLRSNIGPSHTYQVMWDALLTDFRLSSHQLASLWDYRPGVGFLELDELQAPVLFEAADLV